MKIDYDQAANAAYIRRFEGKVIDSSPKRTCRGTNRNDSKGKSRGVTSH